MNCRNSRDYVAEGEAQSCSWVPGPRLLLLLHHPCSSRSSSLARITRPGTNGARHGMATPGFPIDVACAPRRIGVSSSFLPVAVCSTATARPLCDCEAFYLRVWFFMPFRPCFCLFTVCDVCFLPISTRISLWIRYSIEWSVGISVLCIVLFIFLYKWRKFQFECTRMKQSASPRSCRCFVLFNNRFCF